MIIGDKGTNKVSVDTIIWFPYAAFNWLCLMLGNFKQSGVDRAGWYKNQNTYDILSYLSEFRQWHSFFIWCEGLTWYSTNQIFQLLQKSKLHTHVHMNTLTHMCTHTDNYTTLCKRKKRTLNIGQVKHWAPFTEVYLWKAFKGRWKLQNILKSQMNSILTYNPVSIHCLSHLYVLWHPSQSQ